MKIQDSEILRRSSVFRFLSDEHFGAIEPLLQEEHYDFGDVIVKQDEPANSFYVLTRGRARALKSKPDGEEIPRGVLKPGDSFGEAALAEGGSPPRTRVEAIRRDDRPRPCPAKFPLSVQQLRPASDIRVTRNDRQVKACHHRKG